MTNKKRKKIRPIEKAIAIAFLCISFVAVPCSATENSLIDTLSAKAKNIEQLKGQFIQHKNIKILSVPIISEGRYYFSKDKGMIWEVEKPITSKLTLTADGIEWENSKQPENKGSQIISRIFLSVITGDLSQLKDYFHIDAQGDENQWSLILSPSDENIGSYIKTITISGKTFTEELTIEEANGDGTRIQLSTNHK